MTPIDIMWLAVSAILAMLLLFGVVLLVLGVWWWEVQNAETEDNAYAEN